MCGIAGFWMSGGLRESEAHDAVRAMTDCIRHRGPDDDGVFVDHEVGVALGFRRLAILDLTPLGHQPMASPSGRYWLTFNGEIYNHRTLRAELEAAGVTFRGRSDTEVLCAGFDVWGIRETFTRAAGMFGVAVWDTMKRQLTLVRDRIGIKPVYVSSAAGVVSYGSELKSLMAAPRFDRTLDTEAIAEYSALLFVPGPRTVFRRTVKLPPGCLLTITDPTAPLPAPEPYWSLEEVAQRGRLGGHVLPPEEGQRELEALLLNVLDEHLESDVPLGAFLSGGIDSSLVVALMTRVSPARVKTFTIAFDSAEHDESAHAERVAQHLGTEHVTIPLRGADALDELQTVVEHYDEPFADSSQLPSLLVCRAARRHATVVLTGDGGDEIFAGYNRYVYGGRLFPTVSRLPAVARRLAAATLQGLPSGVLESGYRLASRVSGRVPHERLVVDKLRKLGRLLTADGDRGRYQQLVSTEGVEDGQGTRCPPAALAVAFDRHAQASLLDRMLLGDQLAYLPDNQMTKVDRASMAASLEARVPLLDHRVVELAWRLPGNALLPDGLTKAPLRAMLYQSVPRQLIDRPKTGFSVPLAEWLRGPLRPWVEERFGPASMAGSPLDHAGVSETWRRLLAGRDGYGSSVWASLMFESWRRRWMS
ncbi:MAG: asparagine synthase (glutamine-hydrolyzing) [Gemmatimonas sp.]|jgi:asparagine synthase (glutamine-hydrolysing)|uniref:asparagine synthase (glutamine-hydrolyzing) n=1 Tax=Gemmatimonas sp. TaxID=1962908 RepID=UPI00391F6A5A|nr:asparagine synthase (glutamine-hydrolyzing) [Gemmatimonadota bacterium]